MGETNSDPFFEVEITHEPAVGHAGVLYYASIKVGRHRIFRRTFHDNFKERAVMGYDGYVENCEDATERIKNMFALQLMKMLRGSEDARSS